MTGEDWTWQDVPLDAYLDDAVGEAQPLPEPPGRSVAENVREEAHLAPQADAFSQEPPKAAPEAPQSGPSEPAGWLLYKRLRAEGWNSDYAAEAAARHRREEADRDLR